MQISVIGYVLGKATEIAKESINDNEEQRLN